LSEVNRKYTKKKQFQKTAKHLGEQSDYKPKARGVALSADQFCGSRVQ